jgi:hypothetical protein
LWLPITSVTQQHKKNSLLLLLVKCYRHVCAPLKKLNDGESILFVARIIATHLLSQYFGRHTISRYKFAAATVAACKSTLATLDIRALLGVTLHTIASAIMITRYAAHWRPRVEFIIPDHILW